ncbi:MAG TPA: hypothetical protein H9662_04310 [Firmicutes bacterium]|nr:hypothetical protein [Bacillota bacterium]
MQKGKYGLYLWFYAALAFILAILGQTLLCGLLLGFVIIAERDEWLTRQVIQAFCLCFFNAIVNVVLGIFDPLERIPLVGNAFSVIFGIISGVISLLILIFAIVALVNVCRGKEAGVPLAKQFAHRAYGIVEQKVYTNMSQQ